MKTPDSENVLEPLDIEVEQLGTEPVSVHIPQWPGMQAGDRIEVVWRGTTYPEELDPKLEFKVDASALESAGGGHISVTYTVQRKMS